MQLNFSYLYWLFLRVKSLLYVRIAHIKTMVVEARMASAEALHRVLTLVLYMLGDLASYLTCPSLCALICEMGGQAVIN